MLRFSAEENDLWIPGNHRARNQHYDDHNGKFHIALTPTRSHSRFAVNRHYSAYFRLDIKQEY